MEICIGILELTALKGAPYPLEEFSCEVYYDRTALHIAALHGHLQSVKCILSSSPELANSTDCFGYTPLHLAVRSQHESIVRCILTSSSPWRAATSEQDELGEDCNGFTPLHLAARVGNVHITKLLLHQTDWVNIHATTWRGLTALDLAKLGNHVKVVKTLECFDVKGMQLERQNSANSVNAMLVGAALVATVAFGSLLQPPLGTPTSGSLSKLQKSQIGWFFMFIAVSFSCSLVSIVIGTAALIPSRGITLKRELRHLRRSVLRASIFLFAAIFFLMLAFQMGGLVVFMAVTPRESIVRNVDHVVLVGLPLISSAYIFRYVVLPKGMFRCKTSGIVVYFVAFGFIIAVDWLLDYLIYGDSKLRR